MSSLSVSFQEPNWFAVQWRKHPHRCWLAGILLFALVLRLIHLGTHSFWHDEAYNMIQSDNLIPVLVKGELVSNHPPLFVVLIWIWRLFGMDENEWTMRLLPVLLGLGGIAALYLLVSHLFSPRAGLFAAFLLAISPIHILHSQDLKPYIVLPLTGVLTVYFFYRAVQENEARWWTAYAVSAGLACYSETFAVFLLAAINLWMLVQLPWRWNHLPGWVAANVTGALLFFPYLHVLIERTDKMMVNSEEWWIPEPSLWSFAFVWKSVAFGYSGMEPHFQVACVIVAVVAGIGIILSLKRGRMQGSLLMCWFILPLFMTYIMSVIPQFESIFLIRALFPFTLVAYIWAGLALAAIPQPVLRIAGAAGMTILAAFSLSDYYRAIYPLDEYPHRPGVHPRQAYSEAADYVKAEWEEDTVIIHGSPATWLPFYWYGLKGYPQYYGAVDKEFMRVFLEGNPATTDREEFRGYFTQEIQPLVQGRNRVIYVFSEWERRSLPGNALDVWRWLDAHYAEVDHQYFQGIEVFQYALEMDGAPIRTVKRDEDNGVSAILTYAHDASAPYVKIKPNAGLVPAPVEERAGALKVQFAEAVDGQPIVLTSLPETRSVSLTIENYSDTEIDCEVECVASDLLVDITSLWESDPALDTWRVARQYNPSPPPNEYEVATSAAVLTSMENAALQGTLSLAPGAYASRVYMMGTPLNRDGLRSDWQINLAGKDLLAPVPPDRTELMGWHWFNGATVNAGEAGAPLPLEIVAAPLPDLPESYVNLGYIALTRTMEDGTAGVITPDPVAPTPPGEITIPANTVWQGKVLMDPAVKRLDVWVYEKEENGRAYRIIREFDND